MIINIILVFLSAFALCKTINYTRNEDFSIATNKCIALMGLFVVLWCSGYAVVGISTDFSIAMVARTVGYTSVWGYLITEVYFVIRSSKLLENKLKYIIAFFSLLCILDIIYYAASDSIEFVRLQGRTSFYLEAGMASTIHNVIAIAFFVFLFPIALRWLKKSTLKRDKRIIWYLILSNFSIIIGATFDTIMPILGRPVFPMSGVGAFFAYAVILYVARKYNTVSISLQNIGAYVYEHANIPVMAFDINDKLVMCNDCARSAFDVSEVRGQGLDAFFQLSQGDREKMFLKIKNENEIGNWRLLSRKGEIVCKLNFSNIKDVYGDTTCVVCFVNDVSKEAKMVESLGELRVSLEKKLSEKNRQLEKVTMQAITTIANTIDAKDEYTKGHSMRVSEYSGKIAEKLEWTEAEIQNIKYIALLHDIGKIGIPDSVLNKPGKISEVEREILKSHTVIGSEILKDVAMMKDLDKGARSHHERFDGNGYPDGLAGGEIPLIARIICVADSYDAMSTNRVYRRRLSDEQIRQELVGQRGKQFDPTIVDVFIELLDEGVLSGEFSEELNLETFAEESNVLLKRVIDGWETELKESEQKDYLTGLYTRKVGEKAIIKNMAATNGYLAVCDLDNLKRVNDLHGHLAGDFALKTMANVLQQYAGNNVTARLGGDEFVLFLSEMNRDEAKSVAEGIIHTFHSKKEEAAILTETSISIGLSECKMGNSYQIAFSNADKALYYIKNNGKAGYYFYSERILEEENTSKDLNSLIEGIRKIGTYKGVLPVVNKDFPRVTEFVINVCKRNNMEVQLLMISINANDNVELEEKEKAMVYMDKAIAESLRTVDVSTRFSSMQYLIVLSNAEKNNVKTIADRIFQRFYRMYDKVDIHPSYDTASLDLRVENENRGQKK